MKGPNTLSLSTSNGRSLAQLQPWERQPEETWKQYQAFCVYRDLGPDRTVVDVVSVLDGSATKPTIQKWKRKNRWDDRVDAWESWHHEIVQKTESLDLRKMYERQARLMKKFQQPFLKWIEKFEERPWEEQKRKIEELDMKEMVQTLSHAFREEREALGADEDDSDQSALDQLVDFFQDLDERSSEDSAEEKEVIDISTTNTSYNQGVDDD